MKFCDIGNIHFVRDLYCKLHQARHKRFLQKQKPEDDFGTYSNQLKTELDAEQNWLQSLHSIITKSLDIVDELKKRNVLVHCSDGWDRTSQLCATSQLLVEPRYRTIEGFIHLIEKDFLYFGHKFEERLGINVAMTQNYDEVSQVFIQWLDLVRVIVENCPEAFEFNTYLLLEIARECEIHRFENFNHNTQ